MGDFYLSCLRDRCVAILGYDANASAHAQYLRQNGIEVIIGLREGDPLCREAESDGFGVYTLWGAVERADILQGW